MIFSSKHFSFLFQLIIVGSVNESSLKKRSLFPISHTACWQTQPSHVGTDKFKEDKADDLIYLPYQEPGWSSCARRTWQTYLSGPKLFWLQRIRNAETTSCRSSGTMKWSSKSKRNSDHVLQKAMNRKASSVGIQSSTTTFPPKQQGDLLVYIRNEKLIW
jgi:hypothetical protein